MATEKEDVYIDNQQQLKNDNEEKIILKQENNPNDNKLETKENDTEIDEYYYNLMNPDPNKIETTMMIAKREKISPAQVVHNLDWSNIFDFLPNPTKWKYDPTKRKDLKQRDGWTIEIFSPTEAKKLIELTELYGYENCGYDKDYRSNTRTVTNDKEFAYRLYQRIKQCCPKQYICDNEIWEICGLNERFRWCKYTKGQKFEMHIDARFKRDSQEKSFYTVNVYLNDGNKDFNGGRTLFFDPNMETGDFAVDTSVTATPGLALFFNQYPCDILHSGEEITNGIKYLMRTDVMYRLYDTIGYDQSDEEYQNGPQYPQET